MLQDYISVTRPVPLDIRTYESTRLLFLSTILIFYSLWRDTNNTITESVSLIHLSICEPVSSFDIVGHH